MPELSVEQGLRWAFDYESQAAVLRRIWLPSGARFHFDLSLAKRWTMAGGGVVLDWKLVLRRSWWLRHVHNMSPGSYSHEVCTDSEAAFQLMLVACSSRIVLSRVNKTTSFERNRYVFLIRTSIKDHKILPAALRQWRCARQSRVSSDPSTNCELTTNTKSRAI